LYFGCEIAASGKRQCEADTVAVAYSAPKTVWEQWMNITCFAFDSAALRLLFILQHTHHLGDTIPMEATDAILAFLLLRR
jgi:hypothetical protein